MLQYKNDPRVEDDTHGYSAGVSSGAISNWTEVGLSGSHTTEIYWDDECYFSREETRTFMTITDSWTATVNPDTNQITIHGSSSYSMNRTVKNSAVWTCGHTDCLRNIIVYDRRGGGELNRINGSCLTSLGVIMSGSRNWSLTLNYGQSTSSGTFFVRNETVGHEGQYYDLVSAGLQFRNTLPAPKYNPSANTSCSAYSSGNVIGGTARLTNIDYGCPAGNDCSANLTTVDLFSDSGYTNRITRFETRGGSATVEYKGLTPNHRYYVRYVITNGKYTRTYTCSFVTMASSYPYGYKYLSDQVSWLYLQINNGDDECDITSKLYIREKGTSAWTLVDTTTSETTVRETLRNLIVRGKTYESYSTTTNCAGTYTSTIYEFAPPAADSITGVITNYSAALQPSGLLADLDYCYKITSYVQEPVSETNPMISHLEYSTDKVNWTPTDNVTSTVNPDVVCGTLTGLQCSTTYYLRSYQEVGSVHSYSAIVQITTPTCADFENCVCDNLNYMTELICQQLNRLKIGQKKIFANCDTKEVCDPYSNNPTIASILSRLLRFDQAVVCLLCSMEALDIFKTGETDQVFSATTPGNPGQWITLDYYPVEGSENLIASSGVAEAIQDYIESVFHPIGTYEYYAESIEELEEQSACESGESESESIACEPPVEGDRAIIGQFYYTYTNGVWEQTALVPDLGDFAVITILKGTYFDKNLFWWDDGWKLINISGADSLEARIEEIELATESSPIVRHYDDTQKYKIVVIPDSWDDATIQANILPDPEREIIIFTTTTVPPASTVAVIE